MSSVPAGEAPHYRAHIDGLRALAVTAVILFHAGVPGVRGGYVGVDVFFVISGFLITAWLDGHRATGLRSTLREFYVRRGRRILPALLFVLAITSMAAGVILQPAQLEVFSRMMAPAVLMLGNFGAWQFGGYFGWNATDMPLLHLWSIGVEEQFYLLYPLLLLFVTRRWPRARVTVLALVAALSFGLCTWAAVTHPPANYYLLPSRAWELLLGALVALGAFPRIDNRLVRELLAAAGLAAIVVTCLAYGHGMPYPGWPTLIPCGATAALIAVGEAGPTFVNRALSWRPLVFTGLVSYSLYLWHMPVIGLFRYWNIVEPDVTAIVVLCVAIYLLSVFTWRAIELPFRRRHALQSDRRFWVAAATVSFAMFVVSWRVGVHFGVERRIEEVAKTNPEIAAVARLRSDRCMGAELADIRVGKLCRFGPEDAARRVVVWGDSHTWALVGVFKDIAERAHVQVFLAQYPACRPLIGAVNVPGCERFNAAMIGAVHIIDPQLVIFAAYWHSPIEELRANDDLRPGDGSLFTRGLLETLQRIDSPPRSVCVVKTVPRLRYRGEYAVAMARQRGLDTSFIQLSRADAYSQDASMDADIDALAAQARIRAVDPKNALCGPARCRYLMNDGSSIYRDDSHLTPAGATLLASEVERCFDRPVAISGTQ